MAAREVRACLEQADRMVATEPAAALELAREVLNRLGHVPREGDFAKAWATAAEACFFLQSDYRPARALAQNPPVGSLDAWPDDLRPRLSAALLSVSLVHHLPRGLLDEARQHCFRCVRSMASSPQRGAVMFALGFAATYQGDLATLDALTESLLAPSPNMSMSPEEQGALRVLDTMRQWLVGSLSDGLDGGCATVEHCIRHELFHLVPMAAFQTTYCALGLERLDEANRLLATAKAQLRPGLDVGHFQFLRAWVLARTEEWAKARAALEESIRVAEAYGSDFQRLTSETSYVHLQAAVGKADEAVEAGRSLAPRVHRLQSPVMDYFFHCTLAFARRRAGCSGHPCTEMAQSLARSHGYTLPAWWPRAHLSEVAEAALEVDAGPATQLIHRHGLQPPSGFDPLLWPRRCHIRMLGGFALELEGKEVTLGPKRPTRLLFLLKAIVALGGRHVPRGQVIDQLWPDTEGDAGLRAFDVGIHRLRRLLGGREQLVVKDGFVTLPSHLVAVDALMVQELSRRIARPFSPPSAVWRDLELLCSLLRGPFAHEENLPITRTFGEELHRAVQTSVDRAVERLAAQSEEPRRLELLARLLQRVNEAIRHP